MPPFRSRPLAVVLVAVFAAGCMSSSPFLTKVGSPPYVQGSGVSATATRPLTSFTAIQATTAVRVTLVAGDRNEAAVTTDDNLLDHVVTEVRGGTLVVTIEGSIETRLLPVVVVTATQSVDSIALESSATLAAATLDLDELTATLSSASRLEAAGRVGSLHLTVLSASNAELRGLAVETADVSISAASTASVQVKGSVTGSCSASSKLRLVGEPAARSVTVDVSSAIEVE
jgi:hypothetical protein